MVIDTTSSISTPRISANQLGEYVFSTDARRQAILIDQKFGNPHRAPYYQFAATTLTGSFRNGRFDTAPIRRGVSKLQTFAPRNSNHAARLSNNALMLERFLEITANVSPAHGEHRIIRKNAMIELNGVMVSVRPEIITLDQSTGFMSLTKFRFSKSKVAADSSDIILLLLLKFGEYAQIPGFRFDPAETRLVDCFSRLVLRGHLLHRIREQQLGVALRDIRQRWPQVKDPKLVTSENSWS